MVTLKKIEKNCYLPLNVRNYNSSQTFDSIGGYWIGNNNYHVWQYDLFKGNR